jgi:hypothetical protein
MPREGAKLATDAGLDASPLAVVRSMTAVDTILAQAERAHASAIGWGREGWVEWAQPSSAVSLTMSCNTPIDPRS